MPASITVTPWPDPVIDTLGHDPRSWYVETFWLPTLGPTAVLLLRHLADRFDRDPTGLSLPVAETSAALGVGHREGPSTPLLRALERLGVFDLACHDGSRSFAVRRNLPPVHRRHVRRLPVSLQARHAEWVDAQIDDAPVVVARRRARRAAFGLVAQGEDPDRVERALGAVGFHPSICFEAARWATDQVAALQRPDEDDPDRLVVALGGGDVDDAPRAPAAIPVGPLPREPRPAA